MKRTVIILLTLVLSLQAWSQHAMHGMILSQSGDTIAGANIYIKGTVDGATSDESGRFSFVTNTSGRQTIVATLLGYKEFLKEINVEDEREIIIYMAQAAGELDAVIITAGTYHTGDVHKMTVMNSIDIATTAGATADVFGAMKTLPGVMPQTEANGMFVRGGDSHESLTFFDDMLLHKPFGTELPDVAGRGLLPPFMFKGTSFTTGAYSAMHGGALSSAMMLQSKDLTEKTKSDIGIMTAGIDANHYHRFKNSSLDLHAGYFNLAPAFSVVKQNTEWIKMPESVNTSAFYKLRTGEKGLLKSFIHYNFSDCELYGSNYNDVAKKSKYDISGNNIYANNTWQQYIGDSWKINAGISAGTDLSNIGLDSNAITQDDKFMHIRSSATHYMGNFTDVTGGGEFFYFHKEESFNNLSKKYEVPLAAFFLEGNIGITNRLAARPGFRVESTESVSNAAPRFSLAWQFNKHAQLSAGMGHFYQLPPSQYLYEEDIQFEKAVHYLLNYQFEKGSTFFRTEAYYKDYDHLLKTSDEAISYSGSGYARGIDLFLRDKSVKYLDYWISYSWLDTKRNYRDYTEPAEPSFAARHVANLVVKYFLSDISTSLGFTYTAASGRTYYNPLNSDFMSDRTKAYHNLSVNISHLTSIKNKFTIIYISCENVAGIWNVFGYRYSADGSFRKEIVPSANRSFFIGLFITFGDQTFR